MCVVFWSYQHFKIIFIEYLPVFLIFSHTVVSFGNTKFLFHGIYAWVIPGCSYSKHSARSYH